MRIRHVKGAEEAVAANPLVVQDPCALKGRWAEEAFKNNAPVRLEVGMGMGAFIRKISLLNPGINFIGFELNTTVLYKALKRYEKEMEARIGAERPGNLLFIRGDARFITKYFEEGEIDRIYLNFSDPWPKDKNANKRLTSEHFLGDYAKVLKPGGIIEFKTDNEGLFDFSVSSFKKSGWEITGLTRDLHNTPSMNAGNIMTEYEAKFSAKGNSVYKLTALAPKNIDNAADLL